MVLVLIFIFKFFCIYNGVCEFVVNVFYWDMFFFVIFFIVLFVIFIGWDDIGFFDKVGDDVYWFFIFIIVVKIRCCNVIGW